VGDTNSSNGVWAATLRPGVLHSEPISWIRSKGEKDGSEDISMTLNIVERCYWHRRKLDVIRTLQGSMGDFEVAGDEGRRVGGDQSIGVLAILPV
jgi:hypothetical protein